ncbi:MAG: EamA family transporter [Kiritimatiellia bacterium]
MAFILASAVFLAFYDLAKKAAVRDNAVLPVLLFATLFGALGYVGALAAAGRMATVLEIGGREAVLVLVKALIVATSWILTYHALRTLPLTIATPIRASAPALVFAAAFFLYGERPSVVQGAGMLLVFVGYWTFSWAGRHEGIDFFRTPAVWCAIGGMCFSAASSMWDKYILQFARLPVEKMQFWFQVDLVLVYAVVLLAWRVCGFDAKRFQWRWTIPAVGVLLAAADWFYFRGLAIPDVAVSVASLTRRFSVVITFALGAVLFHERNLRRKGLALAAIVCGIALLALGK